MSIFIVDENFFIFQVIYGVIVDIIDRVGVVKGVWWRLLSETRKHKCSSLSFSPFHSDSY